MHKMLSTLLLLALSSVSVNAFSASNKQEVCHKGSEISVAQPAVTAHLNHGDELGLCDEQEPEPTPEPEPERQPRDAAVVMMRCDTVGNRVVVVSASSSIDLDEDVAVILPIPPVDPELNCAGALAGLLNAGFKLRSISSGSAEEDDDLHLYTDYLLIGKVPADR